MSLPLSGRTCAPADIAQNRQRVWLANGPALAVPMSMFLRPGVPRDIPDVLSRAEGDVRRGRQEIPLPAAVRALVGSGRSTPMELAKAESLTRHDKVKLVFRFGILHDPGQCKRQCVCSGVPHWKEFTDTVDTRRIFAWTVDPGCRSSTLVSYETRVAHFSHRA
jgi:hypothetical protein